MSVPKDVGSLVRSLPALAAAAAGGWLAMRAGWPLPWILGPLLVTAAASMLELPVFAPQQGRRLGQMVVGASIGLGLTAQIVGAIVIWLPVMVATSLFAVGVSALLSAPFARLARLDRKTAFFSMMPGGLAEMANIGISVGAAPEAIALSQTIRLSMIVCLLPPVVMLLGFHGDQVHHAASLALPLPQLGVVLAAAAAGIAATSLVRLNNPWMIGSILGAGVLAGSGLVEGCFPFPLYALGQYLIGISIGSRFRRGIVLKMGRVCWASAVFVLVLSGVLFAFAFALSYATRLDPGTAVLAVSAGGIAEMTLTAQNLSLDVALVAAFHFVRAIIVNGFASHFWRLGEKLAARTPRPAE